MAAVAPLYNPSIAHPAPEQFGTEAEGGGASFHGDGAPSASLGDPGATYVDDLTGALYWKSETGWNP